MPLMLLDVCQFCGHSLLWNECVLLCKLGEGGCGEGMNNIIWYFIGNKNNQCTWQQK